MQRCEYAALFIDLVRWEAGVGVGTTGRSWSKGETRQGRRSLHVLYCLQQIWGFFPNSKMGIQGWRCNNQDLYVYLCVLRRCTPLARDKRSGARSAL